MRVLHGVSHRDVIELDVKILFMNMSVAAPCAEDVDSGNTYDDIPIYP